MPTVTAIALETLLEPSSPSSSSRSSPRINNNAPHPSPKNCHHLPSAWQPSHFSSSSTTTSSSSSASAGGRGTSATNNHRRPAANSRKGNISKKVVPPAAAPGGEEASAAPAGKKPLAPIYHISPALYATPEPTRITPGSSPTPVSPSPYVLNHKRRAPPPPPPPTTTTTAQEATGVDNGTLASLATSEVRNHLNGSNITRQPPDRGQEIGPASSTYEDGGVHVGGPLAGGEARGEGKREGERLKENVLHDIESNDGGLSKERCDLDPEENPGAVTEDDFLDPRELMSAVSSSSDTEDGSSFHHRVFGSNQTSLMNQSEYYDANEDFFSDGSVSHSSPSYRANIEADLRAVRLNLFDEIEKRKKAEEALGHMHNQFQRLVRQLAQVGVSISPIQDEENMLSVIDSATQVCQEVVVARFVSEAIERGLARAEDETAAEEVIESKNHEIARLRDRLQYYEAMNHEMSQRNQEAMELARRERLKRKMRRRWIWSCIGLSISVGASLIAYSYLPHAGKGSLPTASQCAEDSSSETVESRGG